ncbi:cytochrome P450 [Streptomyces sp. NPDC059680]|uniref:cytochrome P450 n=1 Tax=Streptomyces sp. NPDC059680 TaxID=3346904 RepID=UPI0036AE89DA
MHTPPTDIEALTLLAQPEGRLDPYPLYDRLRIYPPPYDERHKAVLVLNYDDCVRALSAKGFTRPDHTWLKRRIPDWAEHPSVVAGTLMMQFGDKLSHPRRRGMVNRFFSKRRIDTLVEVESASVDRLLTELTEQVRQTGQADLQQAVSFRLPAIAIANILGIPVSDVAGFRPAILAFGKLLEPALSPQDLAEVDESFQALGDYFDHVIAQRRSEPDDHLISYLVHVHDTDPDALSAEELTAMLISVFGAGTINTSGFIGNGVAALLNEPDMFAYLRTHPSATDAAITEILRYDTPMQITRRMTTKGLELGGCVLPEGTELAVALGAANRDPQVFTDPGRFKLNRPEPQPLSFGGGSYFCIGAAMARQEGSLVFRKLIQQLPTLRLAGTARHNQRSVLRGYLELPVTTLDSPTPARSQL